jgi:hypothetical protein
MTITTLKRHKDMMILSIIFVALMIPNVIVYVQHAIHEIEVSQKSAAEGKVNSSTRQFSEGMFFALIAIGYVITTMFILLKPTNIMPYYVLLIGTVAVIIVYYFRTTTGIPIPGTDLIIKEYLVDYSDVITKIAQQTFVIPVAMMLQKVYDIKNQKGEYITTKR